MVSRLTTFFHIHEDGTMRKSCKSDLVKQFENKVFPVLSLPDFDPSLTTYIRDGMALVQCMDAKKHRTFGDLTTDYYRQLTSCFAKAQTVADVFDRYDIAGSFGNPEIVKVVSDQEVFDCPDLYSTQEEADNRMILQALHADKRLKELGKQGKIIIKTSDTDVIVLCIYFYKQMTNISEL